MKKPKQIHVKAVRPPGTAHRGAVYVGPALVGMNRTAALADFGAFILKQVPRLAEFIEEVVRDEEFREMFMDAMGKHYIIKKKA
jgi:hypothetical protein